MCLLVMPITASATSQIAIDTELVATPFILNVNLTQMEQAALAQSDAVDAYHAIYDHIRYNPSINGKYYHDEYAGCYVNSENKLVVCIKTGSSSLISEINEILNFNPIVEFEFKEWSMNEAGAALEEFQTHLSESDINRISRIVFSSKENTFIFNVSPQTKEYSLTATYEIDYLQEGKVTNYPITIKVMDAEEPSNETDCTNEPPNIPQLTSSYQVIHGGGSIYTNSGSTFTETGTITVCGTVQGTRCILTAYHVAWNSLYGDFMDLYIAENSASQLGYPVLAELGYGDYVALPVPSGYYLNNTVITTNTGQKTAITWYDNSDYDELEGRIVFKYGVETGVTSGTVDNTTYPGLNHNFVDLVAVGLNSNTQLADHGDSGGPVWYVSSEKGYVLVGLVQGFADDSHNGYCYTPIRYAVNEGFNPFGMTPLYTIPQ